MAELTLVWVHTAPSESAAAWVENARAAKRRAQYRNFARWDGSVEQCDQIYLDGDGMDAIAEAYGVPVVGVTASGHASDGDRAPETEKGRRGRKRKAEPDAE